MTTFGRTLVVPNGQIVFFKIHDDPRLAKPYVLQSCNRYSVKTFHRENHSRVEHHIAEAVAQVSSSPSNNT